MLFRPNPDLAEAVRCMVRHLQDPARPSGPIWDALREILTLEYVEALKARLRP